jgi:hypothetical protein
MSCRSQRVGGERRDVIRIDDNPEASATWPPECSGTTGNDKPEINRPEPGESSNARRSIDIPQFEGDAI